MQDDPLSQLRDLHLPADPGWWPPAPGWWLLALALLGGLIYLALRLQQRHRRERPKRLALSQLNTLQQSLADGSISSAAYVHQCNALLKRLWVRVLQRNEAAPLTGDAWLDYLDTASGTTSFSDGPGRVLGNARFAGTPPEAPQELNHLVRQLLSSTDMTATGRAAGR